MAIDDNTRSQVAALLTVATIAEIAQEKPMGRSSKGTEGHINSAIEVYRNIYVRLADLQDVEKEF